MIHNYRWRLGLADGERKYDDFEKRLAAFPVIAVPTITLESDANGAPHPDPSSYAKKFSGNTRTGSSRAASGTTCCRKLRRPLPKLSSMSRKVDPVTIPRGTFVKCRFREWKHSRFTYSAYTSRQNRRSVIREGMGIKLRFARFVGAAAVMVVLLLAPSVASAHAGHHHPAPVPVAHHVTPPENDIPEQAAPKAASIFDVRCGVAFPVQQFRVSRQLLRRHALHGLLRGDRVRPGSFNTPP